MNESEAKFKIWLDYKKYPHVYVDQSTSTFATLFKDQTKRPDFLVGIPNLGLIAIDVKDFSKVDTCRDCCLDEKEQINKASSFERLFRIPYWFAFSCDKIAYKTWYWISLTDILNNIEKRQSSKSLEYFYPIDVQVDCRIIGWEDNFSRLLVN